MWFRGDPHPIFTNSNLSVTDAHVLAAAGSVGDGAAGAGDSDSELQTLQALTNIIAELGNVSSEGSTGSGNGGDGMSAEKQEGQDEEDGPNPAASSTTPEKGKANAAEVPAAAAITAAAAACCSKCHGSLAEDGDAKQKVNAPTVDEETQTATPAAGAAAASDEAPQQEEAGAGAGVFDVDLFKLKRQAAKLRDELAKKRFAEMALDVRLKETEVGGCPMEFGWNKPACLSTAHAIIRSRSHQEEAARLAELLRAKEAVVESLRLELEEKDARLMEFVSRVHDIEVRLARVARERDERTAEAEAAAEAVRFYQAKEEVDDASRRTSLASQQLQLGSRASSVSPCTSMAEGGVEEMKSSAVGGQQQQPRHLQVEETLDEEDAEVAKAVAENKTPSPTPSTATGASAASASPTDTEVDGSLGSVAPLLEAATLEEDEGHQAMRALQTPLERLVGEGMALVGKFTRHDVFLAPAVLATVAVVGLGLIFVLLRAALTGPTDACIKTTQYDGVEEAWMGAKRSPLLRLAPGGAPLLAGEYLSNCAPSADPTKLCYFLWNQFDGNLVLYRGFTPARHRGPVWSTNTLVVPGLLSEEGGRKQLSPRARQVGDHWGTANVTVWLTQDRTLQLVDAPSGQMMWQQRAWRLPRELTPWPFGQ